MKNLIRFISFSLLLALSIAGVNQFIFTGEIKNPRYYQFYLEEENSLDLVVIGNSTVRRGIIPALIYEEYQVTSYNISNSPLHPSVIKIAIDEVGRTQTPKVVFIDLAGITYQKKEDEKSFIVPFINSMPDSEHKNELIKEYQEYFDEEDELFDNHNKFRDPDYYDMFSKKVKYLKGFNPSDDIDSTLSSDIVIDQNKVLELPSDGQNYLQEILETCSKYPNIKFLFGRMPKVLDTLSENEIYMLRSGVPLIEEYGYKWVEWDAYSEEMGLKSNEDFYNAGHMNYYGAVKFTKFFIPYIQNLYGDVIGNKHSTTTVKNFGDAVKKFNKNVKSSLTNG